MPPTPSKSARCPRTPFGNVSHSSVAETAAAKPARRSARAEGRQWIRIGSPFWFPLVLSYMMFDLYLLEMPNDKRSVSAGLCGRAEMVTRTVPKTFVLLCLIAVARAAVAQEISDRFGRWDANKDGKLTREEIPPWFKDAFDEIDSNKDGVITPDE